MNDVELLQTILGEGFAYRSGDTGSIPTGIAEEWLALGYCQAIGVKQVEKKERATYTKREKR